MNNGRPFAIKRRISTLIFPYLRNIVRIGRLSVLGLVGRWNRSINVSEIKVAWEQGSSRTRALPTTLPQMNRTVADGRTTNLCSGIAAETFEENLERIGLTDPGDVDVVRGGGVGFATGDCDCWGAVVSVDGVFDGKWSNACLC